MKGFLRRHGWLHLWLGAAAALTALFFAVRGQKAWMNALADNWTTPLKRTLGQLSAKVSFSVMEVLIGLLVVAFLLWLAVSVRAWLRGERKSTVIYRFFLLIACAALTVYAGFCWLWGVNYYTDSFQDKSGVYARELSVEELYQVTEYFVRRLHETAPHVARDEAGVFAVPREEILSKSTEIYDQVEELFPFLTFDDVPVKPMKFSWVMSRINFTGVYCSFAGESNVSVASPACLLPSTIAHEVSHQRSVASEQECNFLAVLASTTSGDPVYEYSGWLLGYIHLNNALYQADQAMWRQMWDSLPEGAQKDIQDNNAYWAQFKEGAASKTAQKFYDGLLKGYGVEEGIRSYGTVVDLLVAWYGPIANT